MKQKQVWDQSKLTDYLLYDNWQPYNAWCVLAGLDYHSNNPKKGSTIDNVVLLDNYHFKGYEDVYKTGIIDIVDRLRDFWHSGGNDDDTHPPSYFIEWAISKRIIPEWLDWAIEQKLYVPILEEANKLQKVIFDATSSKFPRELDIAIQAWQAVSSSVGKGKPKARIKAWLDNNTQLTNEAKERISIVCNWDKLGGATRTD